MDTKELAKMLCKRAEAMGLTKYQLALQVSPGVSCQTVYNALNGKPIKTDTLLALMEKLGLEITIKKGGK